MKLEAVIRTNRSNISDTATFTGSLQILLNSEVLFFIFGVERGGKTLFWPIYSSSVEIDLGHPQASGSSQGERRDINGIP